MKKKILFVIDSLALGGAEKSLVTLLNLIDYSRYQVDLFLFKHGRELESFLPKEVNVLPPMDLQLFNEKKYFSQLFSFDLKKLFSKLKFKFYVLKGLRNAREQARKYWSCFSPCIRKLTKEYDVAIAYAQRIPTFFVVDKVSAKRKFGWINIDYDLQNEDKTYQRRFYESLDGIALVSESALNVFSRVYPEYRKKMHLIYDINDADFICKMSKCPIPESSKFDTSKPTIVTVARLVREQKGYDICLDAAKILKERGLDFKWFVIGEGPYRKEMENFINLHELTDDFILLGTTTNPYRYMSKAMIYVQTSRHEGFGLSIAEARILNIPIVTTEFDAVYNQIIQGKNGLVVPIDPLAVADAIETLLLNPEKRLAISSFQKKEKKGNVEEIKKFYDLVES